MTEDYIKHIAKDGWQTWCGETAGLEFLFVDLEHAELSIDQDTRLVPCEKCLESARCAQRRESRTGG